MADARMREPGPDHPITITPFDGTVEVRLGDIVVARTTRALCLQEASYPPAYYIPRADIDEAAMSGTAHSTYCPYKGDASYWSFAAGGAEAQNAAWSYEAPYPAVAAIKGHLAFYGDKVTVDVATR